jgi:single-stranded-DNA-specific exonuclease
MNPRTVRRRAVPKTDGLPRDIHPVLRRVYAARRVLAAEELDYGIHRLHPPERLDGMDAAAALLRRHLDDGRILVVGDFDADGATSTVLALWALRAMGAREVDYLVPNRFEFGYGLSPEIVKLAAERQPSLIVTVDNGISSHAGVRLARSFGIEVLITDHHLPGDTLPDAHAIVNPNLPGSGFPSPHLAGVGVIFYVLLGLRALLRREGWFTRGGREEPNLAEGLDLVALGTVADLVPLDRNNRLLVHQGLQRMRAGRLRPGLEALVRVAGRDRAGLTAADLAFAIAPRLNAAGRLDDMAHGIEALLCEDTGRAWDLALVLDGMNRARRDIEAKMQAEAETVVRNQHLAVPENLPPALCLHDRRWHQGIVGLVASRIKDRVHRPVIVFADAGGGMLKGSARSVAGVHVRDAIERVAASDPELVPRFGGHAMAAGLSIPATGLRRFTAGFQAAVAEMADADAFDGVLHTDGELEPKHLSLEVAELIREGGPWGKGFPEPVFDGLFQVLERRVLRERHLKLLLQQPGMASPIEGIAFNAAEEWLAEGADRLRLVYRLDVNDFRGLRRPQLVIEHLEPAAGEPPA